MSLFCSHDWAPRSGMDSGSYCVKCFSTCARECTPGSGFSAGTLLPRDATVPGSARPAAATTKPGLFSSLFS